ncbi:MAG: HIT domain-containing protein, partial [Actinomycetota bacterium]|nr:HIT domain-containing protein [Actinomycetota bacterium]
GEPQPRMSAAAAKDARCSIGARGYKDVTLQDLTPEFLNLITSAGKAAEQTVFHVHFHIVPRWQRDGFGPIWPVEGKYEDADLEPVADRIREACKSA